MPEATFVVVSAIILMKKLISLLTVCIITTSAFSLDLFSIADGNWNSGSVWSYTPGGPPCNCTPSSADNITINHAIILTLNLTNVGSNQNGITGILTINAGGSLSGNYDVDIRSTGTLILCGTLNIRNMIFSNGSIVDVCSTGNLVINGTFENKNNSNTVNINGNMTVHGTFTNGNGGIIGGSGNLSLMTGPATNTGTTLGCTGIQPCVTYPCTVVPCSLLPIQLVSFNALLKNSHVELEWVTATERNNEFFTVERSIDGTEYEVIITRQGAGNSDMLIKYTAVDYSPVGGGISYYRLKQTDYDGKFTYSAPVAVNIHNKNNIQFIPNPAKGQNMVMVIPPSAYSEFSVVIRDVTGRALSERTEKLSSNTRSTHLLDSGNSLKEGIYMVSVALGDDIFTEKVIITY